MQNRSDAYQAILSITKWSEISGIPYRDLVEEVARFVDPNMALTQRMSRLRTEPNETRAETIAKGRKVVARRLIDAAHRQGLIQYGEHPQERSPDRRYVYWRRWARTGGSYGVPDQAREEERHEEFCRRYLNDRFKRI